MDSSSMEFVKVESLISISQQISKDGGAFHVTLICALTASSMSKRKIRDSKISCKDVAALFSSKVAKIMGYSFLCKAFKSM